MGDFIEQTAVEEIGEGRYRALLSTDWVTWGPAGGYVAAVALRAAAAASSFGRPASFMCHFLSVASFDDVELRVERRRSGRRSEALQVEMTQDGKRILDAGVWAVDATQGLEHDYTQAPDVPEVEKLKDIAELVDRPLPGMYANFDRRPTDWQDASDRVPREPMMREWCRFRPTPSAEDRFVDAARSVILIDAFSWPSTWPAHPSDGPSPWIAPNIDLHVRFHHDAREDEWILLESRAELAAEGLIGTTGSVWSRDGRLIAAGSSQLFCRPRPERFR